MATGSNIAQVADTRITDPDFTGASSQQYVLSIHIGATYLTYAYLDRVANQVTAIANIPLADTSAIEWLRRESTTQFRFKQVIVTVDTEHCLIIPSALFDISQLDAYYNFSLPTTQATILSDSLEAHDIHTVYAMDASLLNALRSMYAEPQITCSSSILLSTLLSEKTNETDDVLILVLGKQSMELVATANGKLLCLNNYPVSSAADVLYFAMALAEQVDFDTATVQLSYTLLTEANETLLEELPTYFKHFAAMARPVGVEYHPRLSELPATYGYHAFGQLVCG